jgi:hypothetical protein
MWLWTSKPALKEICGTWNTHQPMWLAKFDEISLFLGIIFTSNVV